MKKPPRNSREPLFGSRQIGVAAFDGLVLLACVLGLYAWLHHSGVDEGQARAASFIALVAGHLTLAPAVMARGGRSPVHHSRILWLVAAGASLLLVLMLVVPELREIMRFAVPDVGQLLLGLAVGIAAGGWSGLRVIFGGAGVAPAARASA